MPNCCPNLQPEADRGIQHEYMEGGTGVMEYYSMEEDRAAAGRTKRCVTFVYLKALRVHIVRYISVTSRNQYCLTHCQSRLVACMPSDPNPKLLRDGD
jgi:hypothetical protein